MNKVNCADRIGVGCAYLTEFVPWLGIAKTNLRKAHTFFYSHYQISLALWLLELLKGDDVFVTFSWSFLVSQVAAQCSFYFCMVLW